MNFVVVKMDEGDSPYSILLGRPWFKQAKFKQDWGATKITIKKGKKKVRMDMVPNATLPREARALYAQGINMVKEVDDDEEDAFLKVNESIVPIFYIDVERILEQYKEQKKLEASQQQSERKRGDLEEKDMNSKLLEQEEKMYIQQII